MSLTMKMTTMTKKKPTSKYQIAYLCNGKDKCGGRPGCFYGPLVNGVTGGCSHTLNGKYALNGVIFDHPCHHPERFDRFCCGDEVRYYEKDGYEK